MQIEQPTIGQLIESGQAAYYSAVWAIASVAAFFRAARDDDYRNVFNLLSLAVVTGFFSFAVVGVLRHYFDSNSGDGWFYLCLAAFLGLLGKEQDKWMRAMSEFIMDKFGINKPRNDK